ncbi:MAG: cytochrome P450 [Novosphingobium sp.]|uniref:cytochrome P450 n=1 Tax=Novosphingobium sp. TaxID=1874826 RepID=UPI002732A971|nr:cytochrome P450 [Novosphingobium sp.]MDP3550760.1 cytochrome P450 [Novosphingobium sp.]
MNDLAPVTSIPQLEADPFDLANILDPYDFHEQLRETGAVVYVEKYDTYAVGRHAEVRSVLSDWETFTSTAGAGLSDIRKPGGWREPGPLVEADPPLHTSRRGVVSKIISPKIIKSWQRTYAAGAADLVARLCDQQDVDGARDIAEAFVIENFPASLGLEPHRENMVIVGNFNFNALGPKNALFEQSARQLESISEWFNAVQGREGITPGSFSEQVYDAEDAGELEEGVARGLVRTVLRGGMDTTISGIASTIRIMSERPEFWAKLRQDRSKLKLIFDEVIRLETPIQSWYRTTTREVTLGDFRLEADKKIQVFAGSANRDPRRWERPDEFDITRSAAGHLAFGQGIHLCIGQLIARMEAESVLNALLDRIERIEPAGVPTYRPLNTMRTLQTLPLRLIPA